MEKVAVNEFVRRQLKGSGKTYSPNLSFEEIAGHAEAQMEAGEFKDGYRDGVRIVHGTPSFSRNFICSFVKIDENTELNANVVKRRPDEVPYIQIRAINTKPAQTGKVEFILYHHDAQSAGTARWNEGTLFI